MKQSRRASAPKSKTGCGTCKIRHKRCDEAKPICENCNKTGRICDGYYDPETGFHYGGHSRRGSPVSTLAGPYPRLPFADQQEAQGFHFFITGTGTQLGNSFQNHSWTVPLLQLSHQDAAIRHAVIAVGAMGRRYQASELSVTSDTQANSLSSAALRQYTKAIGDLRMQLESTSKDRYALPQRALACCILFVIFEFLQGNANGVLIHMSNAIKIADMAHSSSFAQDLLSLITALDLAVVLWLNLDRGHFEVPHDFSQLQLCPPPFHQICNLETLFYDLVGIENDIWTFRHAVACARNTTSLSALMPEGMLNAKQALQSRLDLWHQSFASISSTDDMSTLARQYVLRANHLFALLILNTTHLSLGSAGPNMSDSSSRSTKIKLGPIYFEIVSLVERALAKGYTFPRYDSNAAEEALQPTGLLPIFSFRTSFIRPTFYVAQNAPDLSLRWRAVRLLKEKPWREGAWDSATMGLIAERSLRNQASAKDSSQHPLHISDEGSILPTYISDTIGLSNKES